MPPDKFSNSADWKRLCVAVLLSMAAYAVVTLLSWNLNERARQTSLTPSGPTESRAVNQACFLTDLDSCYWVSYAEQVLQHGGWRVPSTDFDNAPYGREVHWSPIPIWWLIFLSHFFSGTIDFRLNWAAYLASPLLLFLSMPAIAIVASRRFGPRCALIVWLGILSSPTVWVAFRPTSAGHLSWQFLAAFGTIFSLIAANFGYPTPGTESAEALRLERTRNRRWFIFSGLSTGIGLYLGLPNTILIIIPVVTIAIVLAVTLRRSPYFQPECWQLWAVLASGSSLILYLIEYWPHLPTRLEVNHPLYSFALLATGLFVPGIRALCVKRTPHSWLQATVPMIILLAVAAVVALAPLEWLYLRDPYMLKLHSGIQEFEPMLDSGDQFFVLVFFFGTAFFASIIGCTVLVRRRSWSYIEALFAGSLVGCFILGAISLAQVRWHLYFSVAAVPLLISTYRLSRESTIRLKLTFLLTALVLIQCGSLVLERIAFPAYLTITNGLLPNADQALVSRELARLVKAAQNSDSDERPIILSGWNKAPFLVLYGGAVVGSLYWENLAGVLAHHEIFENPDLDAAHEIIKDRQVDFIATVYPPLEESTSPKEPQPEAANRKDLAGLLMNPNPILPSWLQLVKAEQVQVGTKKVELRIYRPDTEPKNLTKNSK